MAEAGLFEQFPYQSDLLRSLFPKNHFTASRVQRLDLIHSTAETMWNQNLSRLTGIKIKYLLIGEAPPWTESGPVRYFYNTCDGAWVNRIWKTFFDCRKPDNVEEALSNLADRGFLLIDSLPFAENFSGKRTGEGYQKLVKSCSSILSEKINNDRIEWADNVRIGLAFKVNGRAVIESLPDGIRLPTAQLIEFSDKLICADGSGYTSPALLRSAFGITATPAR